jgi:hypothetical protein
MDTEDLENPEPKFHRTITNFVKYPIFLTETQSTCTKHRIKKHRIKNKRKEKAQTFGLFVGEEKDSTNNNGHNSHSYSPKNLNIKSVQEF